MTNNYEVLKFRTIVSRMLALGYSSDQVVNELINEGSDRDLAVYTVNNILDIFEKCTYREETINDYQRMCNKNFKRRKRRK